MYHRESVVLKTKGNIHLDLSPTAGILFYWIIAVEKCNHLEIQL